jgi:hypothetical protein
MVEKPACLWQPADPAGIARSSRQAANPSQFNKLESDFTIQVAARHHTRTDHASQTLEPFPVPGQRFF